MHNDTSNKTRRSWELALLRYQNLERAFEAQSAIDAASEKTAWAFHHMEVAKEHLLSLWAPDHSAVREKLIIIWGPGVFAQDDPEAAAMRTVLGDLRRLAHEAAGGSVDEWTDGPAESEA